jgi:hypothetical protein
MPYGPGTAGSNGLSVGGAVGGIPGKGIVNNNSSLI